jgi:hypothetical protein
MSQAFLKQRADAELALPHYRVILINATTGLDSSTSAADILSQEAIQTTGGYQSFAYTYAAGSSSYNSTLQREVAPDVIASFTEAADGTGYDFTHVGLWQGRGARSNRPITSVNATSNRVICAAHGVTTGSLGFVRSTGTLPGGLAIQRYYLKAIDGDTLEFYTDSALTNQVDITSSGSGSLYLVYADGELVSSSPFGLVHVAPAQSVSFVVSYRFG